MKILIAALLIAFGCGVGCAGPEPLEELALAKAALDAAESSGASSIAPGLWHKAEEEYRNGKVAMKGHYNFNAKELFISSRSYSEKAENSARLKKFRSGEGYP